MADLRWFLTDEIERYHHVVHRTLGITPREAWERAWLRKQGVELPPVPTRRSQLLFDFLPIQRRVITREGIEVHGLKYSHADLARQIDPGLKRVVRLDPRDISRIYLERTDNQYLTVPLQRNTLPGMSWWEWRARRKLSRRPGLAPPMPIDSGLVASPVSDTGFRHTLASSSLRGSQDRMASSSSPAGTSGARCVAAPGGEFQQQS
jgi:hypothetical protein